MKVLFLSVLLIGCAVFAQTAPKVAPKTEVKPIVAAVAPKTEVKPVVAVTPKVEAKPVADPKCDPKATKAKKKQGKKKANKKECPVAPTLIEVKK